WQTDNCNSTLAASASCAISVYFAPKALGTWTGQMLVYDSASGSPQSVQLTGTGTSPVAALSPTSLSFTNQALGTTSAPQPVTLTNTGSATLTIWSIAASGDFAQTSNCGTSLAIGASCGINVTFTPSAIGSRAGALNIIDNALNSRQTAGLTGRRASPSGLGLAIVQVQNT